MLRRISLFIRYLIGSLWLLSGTQGHAQIISEAPLSPSHQTPTTVSAPATSPSIVSLSPAATELIYELGLQAHLRAADQNSNYPNTVKSLPNIGDPFHPNAELLALYRPDWVIAFSSTPSLEALQKQLGYNLWIMHPATMSDLFEDANQLVTQLSSETQLQEKNDAYQKIQSWRTLWNQVQQRYIQQSDKTFFVYLDGSPMYTVGPDTFLSRGIQACGVRSAFEVQKQPSFIVSPEALLLHAPDYIVAAQHTGESNTQRLQSIQAAFAQLGLNIHPHQIILAPADILFRPSVRFLKALPQICEQLHAH
ncbi:ABC transporter substrate-binding protein [Pelistega europaea]|uniref:ABC transporter substrate-binding protein n=1 Tax=Pelistega europaea TaxID=106147 RepID=A0A7Y4LAQ4_9BURK|nr:ABC transporter substrate-binding protein [Pelistega europaea]NOL50003.1 ABC transporter substrate-binding protein [Pelistega europaea]